MTELWDLFTRNNKWTGEVHRRGDPIPRHRYHRVVEAWVRTPDGRYLIQQRAAHKKNYPNYWTCSAIGSVIKGERPKEGMIREFKEEIGLDVQWDELKLDQIITSFPTHYYVYKVEKDVKLEDLVLDPEEVQDVDLVTYRELKRMIRRGQVTRLKYYQDFFNNWK